MQQGLLTPLVLEFGNLDFLQIKSKIDEIKKIGIFLEDFGQDSFIMRSYPTWIHGDVEGSVRRILDSYLTVAHQTETTLFAKIAALQARKEITGHVDLSAGENVSLLADLRKSSDPYHDADGKVVLVRISQNDLRKMFKKDE